MTNKMTCVGCDSYTSGVLRAFDEGDPCPHCGLSAEATLEIQGIRKARADDQLKSKLELVIKERDQSQRELRWAQARLAHLSGVLGESVERLGKPLKDEESPGW